MGSGSHSEEGGGRSFDGAELVAYLRSLSSQEERAGHEGDRQGQARPKQAARTFPIVKADAGVAPIGLQKENGRNRDQEVTRTDSKGRVQIGLMVSPENAEWLRRQARERGLGISAFADLLLDILRERRQHILTP